jgi:hypothetical protein
VRIYKDRYYLMRVHPGLSGFRNFDRWHYYITTGLKASNDRTRVVREHKPVGAGEFRLEDGHLPDYQSRADEKKALEWLDRNPYQCITRVDGQVIGRELDNC